MGWIQGEGLGGGSMGWIQGEGPGGGSRGRVQGCRGVVYGGVVWGVEGCMGQGVQGTG